jgi:hypothetical protein
LFGHKLYTMNSIVLHQFCSVSSVLLYRVKLKNLGHINITSIMKRLKGLGGEGGVPADFFLRPARKFPRFPADIPEISWKFRNCPFSRPEEISALGLCKVAIQSLGKLFRTVQRVIPGSEAQNYDDI